MSEDKDLGISTSEDVVQYPAYKEVEKTKKPKIPVEKHVQRQREVKL